MLYNFPYLFRFVLPFIFAGLSTTVQSQSDSGEINALYITGGCCHDYEAQKALITAGISERSRVPISWTIVHASGEAEDSIIPLYVDDSWADGFDIVVHNECAPKVNDEGFIKQILKPHFGGVPAVLIHCAISSYPTEKKWWPRFSGALAVKPGFKHPYEVQWVNRSHPVSKYLSNWVTPQEELLFVKKFAATAEILARSRSDEEGSYHPTVWVNEYGDKKTKVFATSIGATAETVAQPDYLDMIASGFLWAAGRDVADNLKSDQSSNVSFDSGSFSMGRNLFTGQKTSSSSVESSYAIDATDSTAWYISKSDFHNWWQVSLDRPQKIEAVVMKWKARKIHPYLIEGSLNGVSWFPLVQAEPKRANPVTFHRLSSKIQHLRITNPDFAHINGLYEIGGYSTIAQAPLPVREALLEAKVAVPELVSADRLDGPRAPSLTPEAAFKLLDGPEIEDQWDLAFEELAHSFDADAVDGLITRVEETDSGMLRRKGVAVLARVFRNPNKRTWEKSTAISACFDRLINDKRVDPKNLMSNVIQYDVRIANTAGLVTRSVTDENPLLEDLTLRVMENNSVPSNAVDLLVEIMGGSHKSAEIKLKASLLLGQSPDVESVRKAFLIAEKESNGSVKQAMLSRLASNPVWDSDFDWMGEQVVADYANERERAWVVILGMMRDKMARAELVEGVRSIITASAERQGASFHSFLSVVKTTNHTELRDVVETASKSDIERIRTAALEALSTLSK